MLRKCSVFTCGYYNLRDHYIRIVFAFQNMLVRLVLENRVPLRNSTTISFSFDYPIPCAVVNGRLGMLSTYEYEYYAVSIGWSRKTRGVEVGGTVFSS